MTAQIPAIDGWFVAGDEPHLIGSRCAGCGTYFFPVETNFCRNPACNSTSLDEVPLSARGKIWSFSFNHYPAPPPFPAREPFEPYGVAAVELVEERMVVLGMISRETDIAKLKIGSDVELVVEPLWADAENEYMVWKWRVRAEQPPEGATIRGPKGAQRS